MLGLMSWEFGVPKREALHQTRERFWARSEWCCCLLLPPTSNNFGAWGRCRDQERGKAQGKGGGLGLPIGQGPSVRLPAVDWLTGTGRKQPCD